VPEPDGVGVGVVVVEVVPVVGVGPGAGAGAGIGAGPMSAVGSETAADVPRLLEAVTTTSSVEPTSDATVRYVELMAPGIGEQPAPEALHRCHWY
jgi:hypothetical protein